MGPQRHHCSKPEDEEGNDNISLGSVELRNLTSVSKWLSRTWRSFLAWVRRHRYEDMEEEEEEEEEAMLHHQGIAEVRKHVWKVKMKEKKFTEGRWWWWKKELMVSERRPWVKEAVNLTAEWTWRLEANEGRG